MLNFRCVHTGNSAHLALPESPIVATVTGVRIAFGTDEATALTDAIVAKLKDMGHEVVVAADGIDWPDAGRRVGQAVAGGEAGAGVVCCWTGTGVSMAANKVPGVRAALCTDAETARGARRWNDANVLAMGLRLTSPDVAGEMLEAFFTTGPDEGERRLIEPRRVRSRGDPNAANSANTANAAAIRSRRSPPDGVDLLRWLRRQVGGGPPERPGAPARVRRRRVAPGRARPLRRRRRLPGE